MSDVEMYYLGYVKQVISESSRGHLAQLCPLYEAEPPGRSWSRPLDQGRLEEEFPNRGVVPWMNPPEKVQEYSLWQFCLDKQPGFKNPRHYQYRVAVQPPPQPAQELIDLRSAGSEEDARLMATEQGIRLPFTPAPKVFLWIRDDLCVGPLRLEQKPGHESLWVIESKQARQPLRRAMVRQDDLMGLPLSLFGHLRWLLGPRLDLQALPGQVDWAPDEDILKRVLRALGKLDPAYTQTLELTEKAIDHYVTRLKEGGSQSSDRHLEKYRLKRASELIATLQERATLLEAIAAEILRVPAVKELLRRAKDDAQRAARAEIEAERAAAQGNLKKLQAAVEQARQELHDLQARHEQAVIQLEQQFAARRAELEQEQAAFEDALAQRLEALRQHPAEVLAEATLLHNVLTKLFPAGGGAPSPPSPAPPPKGSLPEPHAAAETTPQPRTPGLRFPWQEHRQDAEGMVAQITTGEVLRQALTDALRARGLPGSIGRPLHAAFVAGALPVLAGGGALDALEAYASVLAGGRLLWLPVAPGTLAPADLLGHIDRVTHRFVPAAGGLVDLLHGRDRHDALCIVVLDGMNLAAVEAYLLPLLACAAEAWQEFTASRRLLPLLHPAALAATDPYQPLPWLTWPPNVLLAGILAEGAATVPLPRSLWTRAVLLHLDQFLDQVDQTVNGTRSVNTPAAREVAFPTWRTWREQALTQVATAPLEELLAEFRHAGGEPQEDPHAGARDLVIPPPARALYDRFFRAALAWRNDEQAARVDTLACCLAPWLALTGMTLAGRAEDQQDRRVTRALALAREVLA